MTIPIVEDNAGIRRLLRHAIAGIATEIWECDDGAEALAAYATHPAGDFRYRPPTFHIATPAACRYLPP